MRSMSWCMFEVDYIVNNFLNLCSTRSPTLKVLTATSSKLPSTSLYVSQYRSEEVLKVSPSFIDIDCNESSGLGTLLHVINLAPNALVSSSKDPTNPSSKASNQRKP